jgi:hypothetical protein
MRRDLKDLSNPLVVVEQFSSQEVPCLTVESDGLRPDYSLAISRPTLPDLSTIQWRNVESAILLGGRFGRITRKPEVMPTWPYNALP